MWLGVHITSQDQGWSSLLALCCHVHTSKGFSDSVMDPSVFFCHNSFLWKFLNVAMEEAPKKNSGVVYRKLQQTSFTNLNV